MKLIRIFVKRISARGPTTCPRDRGRPPRAWPPISWAPLDLLRPQLQLYIFRLEEKKIRENVSHVLRYGAAVKQTLQRFSEPKRQAMGEELAKLLEVGYIREIKHPD